MFALFFQRLRVFNFSSLPYSVLWLPFIREEGDPIFVASECFPSKSEGEGGAYLVDGDQFFLLGWREERTWGAYLTGETNSSF